MRAPAVQRARPARRAAPSAVIPSCLPSAATGRVQSHAPASVVASCEKLLAGAPVKHGRCRADSHPALFDGGHGRTSQGTTSRFPSIEARYDQPLGHWMKPLGSVPGHTQLERAKPSGTETRDRPRTPERPRPGVQRRTSETSPAAAGEPSDPPGSGTAGRRARGLPGPACGASFHCAAGSIGALSVPLPPASR